jgi:hypothetical protein
LASLYVIVTKGLSIVFPPFIISAGWWVMNGEGRGAAAGQIVAFGSGADFGPLWPEMQKNTLAEKSAKGVK